MKFKPGDLVRLNLPFEVHLKDGDTWNRIEGLTVNNRDLLMITEVRHVAHLRCDPYYELEVFGGDSKIGWLTDEHLVVVE